MVALSNLRDDLLLEVGFPDTGVAYRIARDGRYLVVGADGSEVQRPPVNEYEQGVQTLPAHAMERLLAALEDDDFFALPPQVSPADPVPGLVLPGGGGPPRPRPIVISARDRSGGQHTVAGSGDPRLPWTYGRLGHIYEAIDREALGGWMNE